MFGWIVPTADLDDVKNTVTSRVANEGVPLALLRKTTTEE